MITFVKDLGMKYQTEQSKVKRRFYLVKCIGCNEDHEVQASSFKVGYIEYCKECAKLKKKGLLW